MADNAGFDPSKVFLYRGHGNIPRNAIRVKVHRSVKVIPDRLFAYCDQLESVLLYRGLLKIGKYAFVRCSRLRSFRCPSTVKEIGEESFEYCSSLTAFELPNGLESIEDYLFCACTSLRDVKIPASVARIGDRVFFGCTNLGSIELPGGLRTIGEGAFSGCRSLRRLRVPPSVVKIREHAFWDCENLASVRLREGPVRIRRSAFGRCTSLERFEFARLSERMEAIGMDDETKSVFDARLREMALAMTGADYGNDEEEAREEAEDLWEKCKMSVGRAHEVVTYLELKGTAPVLELALWKAKIESEGEGGAQGDLANDGIRGQDLSDAAREKKRPKVMKDIDQNTRLSRKDCRVKCGAGIVSAEVLKFFAYSTSWPRLDDLSTT